MSLIIVINLQKRMVINVFLHSSCLFIITSHYCYTSQSHSIILHHSGKVDVAFFNVNSHQESPEPLITKHMVKWQRSHWAPISRPIQRTSLHSEGLRTA